MHDESFLPLGFYPFLLISDNVRQICDVFEMNTPAVDQEQVKVFSFCSLSDAVTLNTFLVFLQNLCFFFFFDGSTFEFPLKESLFSVFYCGKNF